VLGFAPGSEVRQQVVRATDHERAATDVLRELGAVEATNLEIERQLAGTDRDVVEIVGQLAGMKHELDAAGPELGVEQRPFDEFARDTDAAVGVQESSQGGKQSQRAENCHANRLHASFRAGNQPISERVRSCGNARTSTCRSWARSRRGLGAGGAGGEMMEATWDAGRGRRDAGGGRRAQEAGGATREAGDATREAREARRDAGGGGAGREGRGST
jgi:hypothetical protein